MTIETVSLHRIQQAVSSAQFRISPQEVAARIGHARNLVAVDFELVHRLGTVNVIHSIRDAKTGRAVDPLTPTVIIKDSMSLLVTLYAPFPEAWDITVIG